MIEIQVSELQANQTYYIDMRPSECNPHSLSRRYGYKIKAIFKKFVPKNGHVPEYAMFYKYIGVKS